jgi:CRP/FNR family cyclic AMP-dependent transcriptional regulator
MNALAKARARQERGKPMSMVSTLELIRRVPLFSMLASTQAEAVAEAVVKKRYKRGENIVEQGQKSNALYILLTGRARVLSTNSRGREVILATLQVGDYIGEMSLIDGQPHSATVRADTQTDALVLGRAEFNRCLPDGGSMAYSLLRGLVHRLREADRKIESLALVDVYGRVARALTELAVPGEGETLVIQRKLSRQDIAKMVGASREMVSRVMKGLEGRGLVQTRADGALVILKRAASLD